MPLKAKVRKKKWTTRKYSSIKKYGKQLQYKRKTSAKRVYRQTARYQSNIARKLVSTRAHNWDVSGKGLGYVEEICPFKEVEPFWLKAGGLQGPIDCKNKNLYVRGGGWRVNIINTGDQTLFMNCSLGFCLDGSDYISMAGDTVVPWSPYVSFQDIGKRYKISKWRENFSMNVNDVKQLSFKIGSFAMDVNRFINEKKGWPFLWIYARPVAGDTIKYSIQLESMVMFTDNSVFGMTDQEMKDLASDLLIMKKNMYALPDAMQTS